jgi:3-oxoacyl-[acyl-carrier-protein] synthase II
MGLTRDARRRVVVTGMGALTPLGSLEAYWEGLKSGRSGIRRITAFEPGNLASQVAAEVDFNPTDYLDHKQARRMSRASQMALVVARMALEDSGLSKDDLRETGDRVGVSIGTSYAGYEIVVNTALDYRNQGRIPRPLAVVNGLTNAPGHHISLDMGATGPLVTISTACASGTQGIGAGFEWVRSGRADVVFASGLDTLIQEEVVAGFAAMTVLATAFNDRPEAASRPFDADRDGFVLAEGAAVLVLESLEHASARSARIYAEVLGYASSSDAHHAAAPDPEGRGAQRAMQWALDEAGVPVDEVDYINAHGTSTRANDPMETLAIKRIFGARAYQIPVSSTKSMIGHSLGGSGALEAIACIMTLTEGVIHPTINYQTPDPDCDLDYVPNQARDANVDIVLSNSFGFGGQNACLVFGRV